MGNVSRIEGLTVLNGIVLVDKAPGWTSHDVVAKCRGLLREKKIGHGGTLDPMATGLLVLFVGPATKLVSRLPGEKTYLASFRFGMETDTYDTDGNIVRTYENIPAVENLHTILPYYTGNIQQIPPMVSAVKVGGKRLYELARKGIEIERKPRPVTVYELAWLCEKDGEHTVRVRCSAGTYVRSLIHDMGRELGSGAVMTALRRIRSGPFDVEDAVPVGQVAAERVMPPPDFGHTAGAGDAL
ncbi:MAG: tRNA pseudouridine(55) synthase TruB [Oscillospiraceae bacterium]|jgi:tRNA pseudouridine55 synthase|nr:tRNA pseudouridine(55) synthase TruB [Oscillospiraceae bacterium]